MDPTVYTTDEGMDFHLIDLPGTHLQVQVDSHSASPAFAEDNRQTAIALARSGAIDSEDLIHMLHPPGAELLLARLRERQKRQAEAAQAEEKKNVLLQMATGKPGTQKGGKGGGKGGGHGGHGSQGGGMEMAAAIAFWIITTAAVIGSMMS
jgi:hypothetical protein